MDSLFTDSNIWVLSLKNFINQWQHSSSQFTLLAMLIAKWLFYCAMFTFPFALPIAYRYWAIPKNFEEVRNDEVEGYDPTDYHGFVKKKYEKVGT